MAANGRSHSNVQSFLDCATPTVQLYSVPKAYYRGLNDLWYPSSKDTVDFFYLRDLWGSYKEWSAYGTGARIRVQSRDLAVQYYVPYLSAIQIYTTKALAGSRDTGEETENESRSNEGTQNEKLPRSGDAVSEYLSSDHEGWLPTSDCIGHRYMQFFEHSSPYGRVPLGDKVVELAQRYPSLMSLRSADISPASWMSVFWYPIYPIPTTPNATELSACFLTYHTISSSFQDQFPGYEEEGVSSEVGKSLVKYDATNKQISLPPFGLATYRMTGGLWINPEAGDNQRLSSLYSAAGSWLKQLNAKHPDFIYFSTH